MVKGTGIDIIDIPRIKKKVDQNNRLYKKIIYRDRDQLLPIQIPQRSSLCRTIRR